VFLNGLMIYSVTLCPFPLIGKWI